MPRLVILRHAKAAPQGGGGDHARPLVERGRADAARIGAWMRAEGLSPDVALVSDARRTRETMEIVLPHLARPPHLRIDPSLYLAEVPMLLRAVRAAPAGARTALLVGHNPGLAELAEALAGEGDPEARAALAESFPTAAVAVIDFDGAWRDVAELRGRLARFVTARALREVAPP
ncbi:MAG TPA: histidine phosphatase family protein [Beijerinckiaceae bacterium]|jgi:phosphohistidine phosphatase